MDVDGNVSTIGESIFIEQNFDEEEEILDIPIPNNKEELDKLILKREEMIKDSLFQNEIVDLNNLESEMIDNQKIITKLIEEKKYKKAKQLSVKQKDMIHLRKHFEKKFDFMDAHKRLIKEQAEYVKKGKEDQLFQLVDKYELNKINQYSKNETLNNEDVKKVILAIDYTKKYLNEVKIQKRFDKIEAFEVELKDLRKIEDLADQLKIIENFEKWSKNFHKNLKQKMNIEYKDIVKTINQKKTDVEDHKRNKKLVLARQIEFVIDELEEFKKEAITLQLIKAEEPIINSRKEFIDLLKSEHNIESMKDLSKEIETLKANIAKAEKDKDGKSIKSKNLIKNLNKDLKELLLFEKSARENNFYDEEEEEEEEIDVNAIIKKYDLTLITDLPDYLEYFIEENESKKGTNAYKEGLNQITEIKELIEKLKKNRLLDCKDIPSDKKDISLNEDSYPEAEINALKFKMNSEGISCYADILEAIEYTQGSIAECENKKDKSELQGFENDLERYLSYKKEADDLGMK